MRTFFHHLSYPDGCLPESLTSFISCWKVCPTLPFQTAMDPPLAFPNLLPFLIIPHNSYHYLTHYCRHLFILVSLHWNIISMKAEFFCLLFTVESTSHTKVSSTCCYSINICERMNEHTEYNCIVCKTSCFSMCLQSVLRGWWCLMQSVDTNWICSCLATAVILSFMKYRC